MEEYQFLTTNQVLESPRYGFTKGQLNDFLLKRHKNGVDKVVRKIGKRIYWRSDLLDAWINSHTACRRKS